MADLEQFTVDGLTPSRVVVPDTAEEMAQFLQHASTEELAVIPQGNRTKIHCGNLPARYDVGLSTKGLNRLIEFDHENLTVTAEAGLSLAELQLAVREKREFVPLDPPAADRATLGGIVAANSSGPRRLLWKNPRDLVLGMDVALPNGETIRLGGKVMKNVAGYDLSKIFIGSFGSLGVLTRITVRLLALQEAEQTIWGTLSNHAEARRAIDELLASSLLPTAVVYLTPRLSGTFGLPRASVLAVVYEGITAAVRREVDETRALLNRLGSVTLGVLEGDSQTTLWTQISDFSLPQEATGFCTPTDLLLKVTLPITQTTEFIERLEPVAEDNDFSLSALAHAGTGIVYVRAGTNSERAASPLTRFVDRARAVARHLEGSLVCESVPLGVKGKEDVWSTADPETGEPRADFQLMRRVKERFDPRSILSPGRFVGGI